MQIDNDTSIPPGGPAAINGIAYQMLWSLLRAVRAHIAGRSFDSAGELEHVTLILEPIGGGGDLVVQQGARRIVEQLRTRADRGTWSLREILEDVLPDLYLGCDSDFPDSEFRFVTDGRMGNWKDAFAFFRSLRASPLPEGNVLASLNNDSILRFAGPGTQHAGTAGFWDRDTYTERTLFERVVAEIRKRKAISSPENEETTRRNAWQLLGHFEFVGGQTKQNVIREIDAHLLAVVDQNDDLQHVRDALAFQLQQLATVGGEQIETSAFFVDQQLRAVPLTDWATLKARGRQRLLRFLSLRNYDHDLDVRHDASDALQRAWPPTTPLLVITGESGQGKSWHAYGIAVASLVGIPLTVVVEAETGASATMDVAARVVWQEIAGHDAAIPLSQIAQRVRTVLRSDISPWMTLIVDGIQSALDAR